MYSNNELIGFRQFFPEHNKLERTSKDLENICDEFARRREEVRQEAAAQRTIKAKPWAPGQRHTGRR